MDSKRERSSCLQIAKYVADANWNHQWVHGINTRTKIQAYSLRYQCSYHNENNLAWEAKQTRNSELLYKVLYLKGLLLGFVFVDCGQDFVAMMKTCAADNIGI
jgi:hypothetical protein